MDLGARAERAVADAFAQHEELGDEELDIVVGGSKIGSWFKKQWKKVAKLVCATIEIVGKATEMALKATPFAEVGKAVRMATDTVARSGRKAFGV